jgi:hypothetical protein
MSAASTDSPPDAKAGGGVLERERYQLLQHVEDWLEAPMLFLAFVWLALLVKYSRPGSIWSKALVLNPSDAKAHNNLVRTGSFLPWRAEPRRCSPTIRSSGRGPRHRGGASSVLKQQLGIPVKP